MFDIEELVKVLEASRARDTVVIKIPDQVEFANYMVIVSSLTYRHMKAILSDVKWIVSYIVITLCFIFPNIITL